MMITPAVRLRGLATDLCTALAFSTRLPLGCAVRAEGAAVARASWALPIAGAIVGGCGALVLVLAHVVLLLPLPAAALAVVTTMVVTGCLHEDGLADTADGFGGSPSRERKLEIMRDSRIGTYGACAVTASVLLRTSALATLAAPAVAALGLIAAHAAGRALMPVFMALMPPARRDGLAAEAGVPPATSVVVAGLLGALALALGLGPARGAVALLLLCVTFAAMARLCVRQIGGHTGDVLGALEQAGEVVVLLCAAAAR
jgi:adenosylcobinamide-GDP ribazoletransferase